MRILFSGFLPISGGVEVNSLNPLTPGVHLKAIHTSTNLQLSAAGLFKYV